MLSTKMAVSEHYVALSCCLYISLRLSPLLSTLCFLELLRGSQAGQHSLKHLRLHFVLEHSQVTQSSDRDLLTSFCLT